MTHPTTGTTPTIFTFQNGKPHPVRIYTDDAGDPLFHAADLCDLLEHTNAREALRRHVEADDVTKRDVIDRMGRTQQANFVREPGMWSLLLGSHAPNAKKVKRWITAEVLPAIRKTGSYHAVPPAPTGPVERYVDLTTHQDIRYLVQQLETRFWFGGSASHAAWSNLRKIGGARATAFPESQVPRALDEMRRIAMRAEAFFQIKCTFEEAAIKWVFGTDAEIIHRPELPPMGEQLRLQ